MYDKKKRNSSGFTLVEVMVASGLMGLVVAGGLAAFWFAARMTRAGGYQVEFNAKGRATAQKIIRYVENGKAVAVTSNGLDIMQVDFSCSRLSYLDQDGDQQTLPDNMILYYTNSAAGGAKVLCTHVTPIAGEPVFSIVPSTPSVAKVCFHVGDGTDVEHTSFSGTGQGYQGIEVRVSATPRNLQRWYD